MKNKNRFLLALMLLFTIKAQAQRLQATHLLCEYQTNPIGVESLKPKFNWQLQTQQNNIVQTAYRVLVANDTVSLNNNKGNVWDSGKINSSQSIQVVYNGKSLQPVKTYYWKVMVWDNNKNVSAWSKKAFWQMGLLNQLDWKGALWIGYEKLPDSLRIVPAQADNGDPKFGKRKDILPLIRKEVFIKKAVKKATMFICGLGQFELYMNGNKIGDHFLDPGWTKYDKQALYVTFDVTKQIKQGNNALGIMLGNGFYYIPGERYRKITGAFGYPQMICRLVLQYKDGSGDDVISDDSWKAAPGPVTFSSIYGGEDYDANLEQTGWKKGNYNDKTWKQAVVVNGPPQLNSQAQQPLKVFENFTAKITQPKPGVWVYDFGQNASGIPFIGVKGKKGETIKIIPGELLAADGTVTQNAIGSPVYFNYTLKGGSAETWQPQFMYYGFRYVQINGAVPVNETNTDQLPVITQAKLLHTRNSATQIGSFSCSNNLFNKTFKLIDWAIRSNTVSIFTDCPHREKLGWLEEAHLVGSSIRYNYDIATLCNKVITDMKLSQTEDGLIPDIAPEYVQFGGGFRDSPEWGSNGIIMPWYVYQWYGDKQVLTDSYTMMTRYAAYLEKKAKNHILYFGLGDWYDIGPKEPGVSQLTPGGVTSTAIYYYDLTILSKIAAILGKSSDEQKYIQLSKEVKTAFNNKFFNKETNQYATGSQTANAMAIYMGLTEPGSRQAVVDNLVKDLRNRNNSLTAGDIGYRYLLRALDDAGRSDVIFDMNSRSDVPGYGYQLAQGATSLTESWQGNRISSNNHFMLGHLMEWFYSGLGGIKSAENSVAFHDMEIRPEPVGDVTYVKADHISPYGPIHVEWKKNKGVFNLSVKIPANTKATIYLPSTSTSVVTESGRSIASVKILKYEGYQNGRKVITTGSGSYNFQVK
ncbi:family 78 glycoside hydrolase catalytic domain [Mucilaginibacter terrae]|uniref:family 78 glycoside hydrolase catalytic domain n=1 Tax=Mucilaginibacter terrae TaxID=1955052 RepID=UPI00363265BC